MTFSDHLRNAIITVGDNPWLARKAKCSLSSITRFINGERGLSTSVIDRLLPHLPMEVCPKKRTRKS